MLLLPKTIGPITLLSKLGTGGVAESYRGTFQGPRIKEVVVRRVLPYVVRDPERAQALEHRVRKLLSVDHPQLVKTVEWMVDASDRFIVEEKVDGISLRKLLNWTRSQGATLPPNVFLNLATQMCTALDALHSSGNIAGGLDPILHLGLKPATVFLTREGQVLLGGYGLTPSPTLLPQGSDGGAPVPFRMEYLSPEQAISGTSLTAASDLFSLGSILYELLTLEPLFRSPTGRETLQKVQRAEITTNLLRAQAIMPGFDKILYRALSLNPRHRYQRAFVMREDIRALMSGYSFSFIDQDTISYLEPLFSGAHHSSPVPAEPRPATSLDTYSNAGAEHTLANIHLIPVSESSAAEMPESMRADEVPPLPSSPGPSDSFAHFESDTDSWALGEDITGEITNEQETEVTAELPASNPLPPPPPIPPPLHRPTEPSGPRTVAQIQRPSDPEPDPYSPAEPRPHREAHVTLRNIRAAATGDSEDTYTPDAQWSHSKRKRNVTVLAALAGMSLIFTAAAGIYWGIGSLFPSDDLTVEAESRETVDQHAAADPPPRQPLRRPPPNKIEPVEGARTEPKPSPSQVSSTATTSPLPAETMTDSQGETSRSAPSDNTTNVSNQPTASSFRPEPNRPTIDTSNTGASASDIETVEAYIAEPVEPPEAPYSPISNWDDYSARAQQGRLTPSDRIALEGAQPQDEDAFTRSRALLLMNAQQTRDHRATRLYLDQLFLISANKYNPLYLTAEAVLHVDQSRFEAALISASKAEKHWESIPSDLMVLKLAEIYETKAQSHLGLYYQSEDINDLDRAERAWKRFREHALRNNQASLLKRADLELDKLAKTRERME